MLGKGLNGLVGTKGQAWVWRRGGLFWAVRRKTDRMALSVTDGNGKGSPSAPITFLSLLLCVWSNCYNSTRHTAPCPYYDENSAYKCCCLPFGPLYAEILSHLACPKSENRNVPARASKSDLIWYKLPFCFFLCLFHFIIYYHFNSVFFVNGQYMLSKGNLLG